MHSPLLSLFSRKNIDKKVVTIDLGKVNVNPATVGISRQVSKTNDQRSIVATEGLFSTIQKSNLNSWQPFMPEESTYPQEPSICRIL